MDAVKFFKEMDRMCKAYCDNPYGERDCKGCPLEIGVDECMRVDMEESEKIVEIVEIVERWSKENPVKTYKDDFLEKFPNAKTIDGELVIQWCRVYNKGECNYPSQKCVNCWHQALGE